MHEHILDLPCPANEVAFNPGLVPKAEGGYLLAYRKDCLDPHYPPGLRLTALQYWGVWQSVVFQELTADFKLTGHKLEHGEGQDPRLFRAFNRTWCSYATSPRGWRWWLMSVDYPQRALSEPLLPDYRRNRYVVGGPPEKNWTWIDNPAGDYFDCIYSFDPYRVIRFDRDGNRMQTGKVERTFSGAIILEDMIVDLPERPVWRYGPIRGGSPAVLLPSGERFAAFHGYLSAGAFARWYVGGGILMEPEWPYRPIKVLQKPILAGPRRFTRWPQHHPVHPRTRVSYPCGVVAEKDRLIVSYGVDDCRCAIATFSYDELKSYDTAP